MPFTIGHPQFNTGRTHFKKGMIPWNKGKRYSISKPKKRAIRVCINCGKEFEIEVWRLKDKRRGKFCSIKCNHQFHRGKNSHFFGRSLKGKNNPSWKGGKPKCIDCGKELSIYNGKRCQSCNLKFHSKENHYLYGKKRLEMTGEKHPLWKGNDVSYSSLHVWVRRHRGKPTKCELCGKDVLVKKKIHWANKSGEYKRDLDDWLRLCASCHGKYDTRNKLRGNIKEIFEKRRIFL